MNRLTRHITSLFLLLCFSVTLLPLDLFHHHHESAVHCEKGDAAHENNPCHISSYHAAEAGREKCDHEAHINKEHHHCHFCKIITPNRKVYAHRSGYSFTPVESQASPAAKDQTFIPSGPSKTIFSRGPPA